MNFDIKNSRDFWEKIYCNRIVTDIRYLHILRRVFDKERTIKNTGTDWVVVATPSQIDAFADKIAMQVIRFYELKTDGNPKPSKYLDTKEASNFLSKTPNAVRVMVCKNQIKSIKKGKSLYYKTELLK